jgi:hypothetical protein
VTDIITVFALLYLIGAAATTYMFGAAAASMPQSRVDENKYRMVGLVLVWPLTAMAVLLMLIFTNARSGGGM